LGLVNFKKRKRPSHRERHGPTTISCRVGGKKNGLSTRHGASQVICPALNVAVDNLLGFLFVFFVSSETVFGIGIIAPMQFNI
jgi:hypothetical protein